MQRDGSAALQYATSEGLPALRQAIADMLPWQVDPEQVLITTGSQQALDLIGKIFLDHAPAYDYCVCHTVSHSIRSLISSISF